MPHIADISIEGKINHTISTPGPVTEQNGRQSKSDHTASPFRTQQSQKFPALRIIYAALNLLKSVPCPLQ